MSLRSNPFDRQTQWDTGEAIETTLDALLDAAIQLRPNDPSWAFSLLGLVLCPDRAQRDEDDPTPVAET